MFIGIIKEETPETITLEVNDIRLDGSKRKNIFICDKNTVWARTDKAALVNGDIFPSNQKDTFFLKWDQ